MSRRTALAVAGYESSPAPNPAEVAPEVAALEARLERLAVEYAKDGLWTKEQYLRHRAGLEGKLDAARDEAAKAATASAGWRTVGIRGWWDNASDEQKRATVRDYVRGVTVQPVGRGYRGDTTWQNTSLDWTEKGQALSELLQAQAEQDAAEAS